MVDLPLPLIGATNGPAYGGGPEILRFCGFPYTSYGGPLI